MNGEKPSDWQSAGRRAPKRASWRRRNEGVRKSEFVLLASELKVLTERLRVLELIVNSLVSARWGEPPEVEAHPPFDASDVLAGHGRHEHSAEWILAHAGELYDGAWLADLDDGGPFDEQD